MTPLASDGSGQPLPTHGQLLLKAQYLAVDYRMAKGAKNTVEAQLVHTILCLEQASSDFNLRRFCDDNDLHYSTMAPYVSDVRQLDMNKRLQVDPHFKMPVTGWRYLVQAIRKGLPEDMAMDVAERYLEADETGQYNELGLLDASLANMKEEAMHLAEQHADGRQITIQRKKYPASDPQTGAKTRFILEELGMVDVAAIDERGWYRIAVTVIEEIDE